MNLNLTKVCSLLWYPVWCVWQSFSLKSTFHFVSFTRVSTSLFCNTFNGAWQKQIQMSIDSPCECIGKHQRYSHNVFSSLFYSTYYSVYFFCFVSFHVNAAVCLNVCVFAFIQCAQSIFSCRLYSYHSIGFVRHWWNI